MDIRVLNYFLVVAREESFSRAAEALYISQPTLSRQIRDMEEELGVQLLVRTNRNVHLTQEGMRLRKRAQEIVALMDKTREEFARPAEEIAGDIYIGSGETQLIRPIGALAVKLRQLHPGVHYHLYSGNADSIAERLDRGLLDFGIMLDPGDIHHYESLQIPGRDVWGVLMRRDCPLAEKKTLQAKDLYSVPLLISAQNMGSHSLPSWLRGDADRLDIIGSYNLLFNAAVMVEQGLGCAVCLDHLADVTEHTDLCFRPFYPIQESRLYLVWKRYQLFSPPAEVFLRMAQDAFLQGREA